MTHTLMTLIGCAVLAGGQTIQETMAALPLPTHEAGQAKAGTLRPVVVQGSDAGAPFVINDNGIRTSFRIVNLENRTAEYLIQFLTPKGEPLEFPLEEKGAVSALRGTIAPNSMLELRSTGAGGTVLGWAVLVGPAARIATQVSIQTRYADGSWHSTSHHGANAVVKRVKAPYDNRGGYATSVLFANPNSEDVGLTVVIRDAKGEVLARQTYLLAGSHSYSIPLVKQFPATEGGTGTVEFAIPAGSTLGFPAVSLRVHERGAIELLDALTLTDWAN